MIEHVLHDMRTLTELEKAWFDTGYIYMYMSGEHIVKNTVSLPMVDLGVHVCTCLAGSQMVGFFDLHDILK